MQKDLWRDVISRVVGRASVFDDTERERFKSLMINKDFVRAEVVTGALMRAG